MTPEQMKAVRELYRAVKQTNAIILPNTILKAYRACSFLDAPEAEPATIRLYRRRDGLVTPEYSEECLGAFLIEKAEGGAVSEGVCPVCHGDCSPFASRVSLGKVIAERDALRRQLAEVMKERDELKAARDESYWYLVANSRADTLPAIRAALDA